MDGNNEFDEELGGQGGSGNILNTLLRDYIPYWPVVVAAAIIGYISAKVYLRYQRPVYEVNASLLIKDDSKSTDNLVKTAVLGQGSTTIEDQIELLKSAKVMNGRRIRSMPIFSTNGKVSSIIISITLRPCLSRYGR